MKIKRRWSPYDLARRLQCLALQISLGKPNRIGSTSARTPAHATGGNGYLMTGRIIRIIGVATYSARRLK